jgi:hypothetical protein
MMMNFILYVRKTRSLQGLDISIKLLFFDEILNNIQGCSPTGSNKIAWRPQTIFRCQVCGHEENADINAAKNILTVGQTGACRAHHRSGRQLEPAGNLEGVMPVAC